MSNRVAINLLVLVMALKLLVPFLEHRGEYVGAAIINVLGSVLLGYVIGRLLARKENNYV